MEKLLWILSLSVVILTGCVPPPPEPPKAPDAISLNVPTLIKSGFVRLQQAPQHFIDGNRVTKSPVQPYLIDFDVVVNLEKSQHVYPDNLKLYAKSLRKKHRVNCDTQTLEQLSTTYYSEFWGEGEPSPITVNNLKLTKDYKHSALSMLGRVVCASLYRHEG
ncbi:surface-adhesin E family protein [Pasteurella sp. PK-2025]|uniref:surface-adhesin E family protein n=1 Tax=Pasteurella sp. PK-2025 TaxID=3413133 RepID=UPI003C78851A